MGWRGPEVAIPRRGPLEKMAMLSPRRLQRLYIKSAGSPIDQSSLNPRRLRRLAIVTALLVLLLLGLKRNATFGLTSGNFPSFQAIQLEQSPGHKVAEEAAVHPSPAIERPDSRHVVDVEDEGGSHFPYALPDVLKIPFGEAVADVALEGWEDEWFSAGHYDNDTYGGLEEPKMDFVYNWVNGSDEAFKNIRRPFELDSPLNTADGKWLSQHSINRYRDWDELRYSLRSVEAYANGFLNKIQLLVNSVGRNPYRNDGKGMHPQRPTWLREDEITKRHVQVLSHESFFQGEEKRCLPTFNSLSIESQIHRTPSSTDNLVALSDDMFLGMPHAASDFYSPLFGPVMGFKSDHYNVKALGGKDKIPSFGEKPFVYYTSYLLNHRFGHRNRQVQAHFGHSVSRAVMREAMASFPQPSAKGACERFRGESDFQIYPWFAVFHYSIERFREALLWSYITTRADADSDGYLDWAERQQVLRAIEPGWRQYGAKEPPPHGKHLRHRDRMYYELPTVLRKAGLQAPKVNVNTLWTSMDGPATIRKAKCHDFNVDKCFADSFASPLSDQTYHNPDFTISNIFSRLSHQHPHCGDCLMKFVLASTTRGLEPLLPPKARKNHDRQVILKALKKYQHTVVDTDAMKFVMVKDAEQAREELLERTIHQGKVFGQWCLNDDVMTESAFRLPVF
ncbi:hypothetical protein F4780DRAFT_754921 [Xylariomycetidae sp. FL0641]|nr:hypothetical protein F4780DRAFT_754921 [Xylariomycetidae sp. FL0641]